MNKTKSIALVLRKKHSIRQPTELKIFFEKTVQYLYSYHLYKGYSYVSFNKKNVAPRFVGITEVFMLQEDRQLNCH